MKWVRVVACLGLAVAPVMAQTVDDGPRDERAQKTYKDALLCLKQGQASLALDQFKKADKQDGGHCRDCQRQMIRLGQQFGEWKIAYQAAEEQIADAKDSRTLALAHFHYGILLMNEGQQRHKNEPLSRAHEELGKALEAAPNFPDAVYFDGQVLAQLKQDDAAKARFEVYLKMTPPADLKRQRAERYVTNIELARARMAPPFGVTTADGRHVTLDDLQGKVVLLDFWATWCEPCREAMPHIREIAKKFQGQPMVVLSVSLDDDEQKWREFIAKNEMTWLQARDAEGFDGKVAKTFGVDAIPHTFTIDADGVLQDEHIGDASMEGKLKKLIARARELQSQPPSQPAAPAAGSSPAASSN